MKMARAVLGQNVWRADRSLPLPFIFLSLPLPAVRSRPLKYIQGVWGSAVSSPSGILGILGGVPAEIDFCAF